ncbi:MAG TPA: sigma-70 family RNA polymerase sigma factor [Polyangiaceae bacterium]|jgi:RNA polymerase sigma-70 factor (ECF subfamily)|nr:sigma-70 family RNA polymerase sigma factor [Polyangiaceae bacterium]
MASASQLVAPKPVNEALLIDRARHGDGSAFASLVRAHQARAHALAVQLVKDEHDAREIVQEAFLRVYRALDRFEGDSAFFTWLYRIVNNLAIDFMRRPQRRECESLEVLLAEHRPELAPLSDNGDPFEALANKRLKSTLERSVRDLPDYHRSVIELRELQGMSYEEIAQATGVSKGTIMSRLFHARQKLQRSLRQCALES